MLLANTVTAAVSIRNSIQTADYVEQLAQNLTTALLLEEKIDNKLEPRDTVLEDTVVKIGKEVEALRVHLSLRCHARYQQVCVTPHLYNRTQ